MIGLGGKSFTVLVTRLGEECRMFTDEMDGIEASFDEEAGKELVLTKGAGGGGGGHHGPQRGAPGPPGVGLQFTRLALTLLCPVVVHLSAKDTAPIDVRFTLVCGGRCSDNELFTPANFA